MTSEERIALLEHRVRELQTAVAAIVRHLGINHLIDAAERARLDEVKARGDLPSQHLSELYDKVL